MQATTTRRAWADRMAEAATLVIDSLDDQQRDAATWPFPSDDERRRWFYTPTDHGGLALSALSPAQHQHVHRLVASGLSRAGYVTVAAIMGLENILDHTEGWTVRFGRPRGRDPLAYWVAVFGRPGSDAWAWRFGGHHISLHYTIIGGEVVGNTPSFFGADPAASPLLGPHLHRPLAAAEDLGRELVRSLDETQRSHAIASAVAPPDLIGANRTTLAEGDRGIPLPDIWRGRLEEEIHQLMERAEAGLRSGLGYTEEHAATLAFSHQPKGLAAAALTADQREVLTALLGAYLDRLPDEIAAAEKAKVTAGIEDLHVLWAGGLEAGEPHYYRLQSDAVLIEYDNAARGANHVHTVWRDLSTDFGGDPLAAHYTSGHHRH